MKKPKKRRTMKRGEGIDRYRKERRDVNTKEMRNENAEGDLRKHIYSLMFI